MARLANGELRDRIRVGHGEDPVALLRCAGWQVQHLEDISGTPHPHEIVVTFQVAAALQADPQGAGSPTDPVPHDPDLTPEEVATAVAYQRIAAYAVVTSDRGVLLTELSDRTNAAGLWTLPGGGIDPEETPQHCVRRELWEETGQQVGPLHPLGVLSRHWIGRAPSGRVEDYHVVGLVFTAHCEHPTEPVVHDTGGTTESAAWIAAPEVNSRPLSQVGRWALEQARVATD